MMSEETVRRGPPAPAPESKSDPKDPMIPTSRRKGAPVSRVKSSGRLSRRLEELGRVYKAQNPGMSIRWVYDPKHKPDLSNILSRQVDGYVLIYVKDLGEELAFPGMDADEPVRVGDTVMMAIAEVEAREMREDLDQIASDEMSRVDQEFRQSVEDTLAVGKGGKTYHPRPVGISLTEAVEADVAVPLSHSDAVDS